MLSKGHKFPEFTLNNQDGKAISLHDLAGHWALIYVYPKDDTPGCTIQAKSFTAMKDEFEAHDTYIYGLSQDDASSHKNFCAKYSLAVMLLSDPEATLLSATGIGQTEHGGNHYWNRTSFLLDPHGIVRKVYEKVDPNGHEQDVLADVKAMQLEPVV
jgi:peroxiredoxin Q/BCP